VQMEAEREQIKPLTVPVEPVASVPLGAPAGKLLSAPATAPSVSEHARVHLRLLQEALSELPLDELERLSEVLFRAYRNDKQVFTLGNGGSSSTASHMAADLAKNTIGANMHRFRIMCLSDNVSIMTALANDVGYESIFSEQLMNHIRAGDVLLVVSASGNSPNVLKAMRYAQSQSAEVAALLGFDGGTARSLSDIPLVIPSDDYGVVENAHLVVNHILVDYFKKRLMAARPWLV
jgi:D-sedoheptulose 7-phosphate isomerase